MNILLTGSSGLVGRAVAGQLARQAHRVVRLVRQAQPAGDDQRCWDPVAGRLDPAVFDGIDAVVHLAGENIAAGRWTPEQKARIRDSRVGGTRLLCEAITRSATRPKLLISASATGWYGDRGDEVLTEQSPAGAGFLADVCRQWEAATLPAVAAGVRTVQLRIGLVLSATGGALAKMLPMFRFGLGGRLGSGQQYMSWISLLDLAGAVSFLIDRTDIAGPVNATSPNPVTNAAFTKALGQVLQKRTFLSAPGFALRLAMGEMADALLLASTRVEPRRLQAAGFPFEHVDLTSTLRTLIAGNM